VQCVREQEIEGVEKAEQEGYNEVHPGMHIHPTSFQPKQEPYEAQGMSGDPSEVAMSPERDMFSNANTTRSIVSTPPQATMTRDACMQTRPTPPRTTNGTRMRYTHPTTVLRHTNTMGCSTPAPQLSSSGTCFQTTKGHLLAGSGLPSTRKDQSITEIWLQVSMYMLPTHPIPLHSVQLNIHDIC
jgi:hypothetical protein